MPKFRLQLAPGVLRPMGVDSAVRYGVESGALLIFDRQGQTIVAFAPDAWLSICPIEDSGAQGDGESPRAGQDNS